MEREDWAGRDMKWKETEGMNMIKRMGEKGGHVRGAVTGEGLE